MCCLYWDRDGTESQHQDQHLDEKNQSLKRSLLKGWVGAMRLHSPAPLADLPVMLNDMSVNLGFKLELSPSPQRPIFSIKPWGKVPNYQLPCVLS